MFCIAILQVEQKGVGNLWTTSLIVFSPGQIITLEGQLGYIEVHSVYEEEGVAESRAYELLAEWQKAAAAGQTDIPGIPAAKHDAYFVTAYTRWNADNNLEYRGRVGHGHIPAEIPEGWDLVIVDVTRDGQVAEGYWDVEVLSTAIATIYNGHFNEA